MSLVICTITDNFALMGAEKRGILGDKIYENSNKIIKVNKNIIFGCTGGILDNQLLFEDFCEYIDGQGLVKKDCEYNISYNDFINQISGRFHKLQNIHNDYTKPRKFNIQSIVCGFNGECFEIVCFNLTEDSPESQGIFKATKSTDFPYKGAVAGKIEHLNTLHQLVYLQRPNTVLQYKNIMKDVFEKGVTFDDTINTNYCFEKIRLKDVIDI